MLDKQNGDFSPMGINNGVKIPSSVKIGYRSYEIKHWDMLEANNCDAWGMCDNTNAIIWVCTDLQPRVVVDTLLHEIMHAIWYYMGLDEKHGEEPVVHRLGTGLTQVFCDNPTLVRWIDSAVSEKT
jgi:hypothetical protein